MPEGVEHGIIKGMYKFSETKPKNPKGHVRLLGSGAILNEVLKAADILAADYGIHGEVFSVTSYTELAREGSNLEHAALFSGKPMGQTHVQACLGTSDSPVISASDYIRAHGEQIRRFVSAPYTTLGTDGFGRSDTRSALRRFFEVDSAHIAWCALATLVREGTLSANVLDTARGKLGIDANKPNPFTL